MLCYRCEYRARYLETNSGPRIECKQIKNSVYTCYMYMPTKPIDTKKHKPDDKRPAHAGPMLGARMSAIKVSDGFTLNLHKDALYWEPKND